jgi:hypothetical protein
MRRFVLLGLAGLLLVSLATPAAAHTNDIEADTQVSADGAVRVESALLLDGGHAVVRRNGSDGRPGEPIGHVRLGRSEFRQGFTVPIDDDVWAEWGDSRTVWVVLHREAGGDGFDPDEDPIQENTFGRLAAERITLAKGDGETSVVAERFEPQQTGENTVTVGRVALATDGHVAVRAATDEGVGRVLGSASLPAGVTTNVSVEIDGSVFAERGRSVTLVAQAYAGDGGFENARQVRAGGVPVASEFEVERTGSIDARPADGGNGTDTPAVVTPTAEGDGSGTTTAGTESRVVTPAGTPTATPTTAPDTATTTTGGSGTGFGIAAAAAGIAVFALSRRL